MAPPSNEASSGSMKKSLLCLSFLVVASPAFCQLPGDTTFGSSHIHTIKLWFSQTGWWDSLTAYYSIDKKLKGDFELDGTTYYNCGIQFKGNSSYNNNSNKKSFKIDFSAYDTTQEWEAMKTVNLNNGFKDPSFMREKLMLDFCQRVGIAAPRCTYANVYLNGQLWGLYDLVEQVDKTFLKTHYNDKKGNLFKGDPNGTLQWWGPTPSTYYPKYELKTNKTINDWSDLVHLIDKLNNSPVAGYYDSIQTVLDYWSAIDYWAANIVFVSLDSYQGTGHNYYIYHDSTINRFHWIMWDVNEAFGNFNMNMSISQLENLAPTYISNPPANRPLEYLGLQNPQVTSDFINKVCAYSSYEFTVFNLYPRIDSLANRIRPSVYADPNKFFTNQNFEDNINVDLYLPMPLPGLKSFIYNRRNDLVNLLAPYGCTLGIPQDTDKPVLSLFPNPASDRIFIRTDENGKVSLKLMNTLGQVVFQQQYADPRHIIVSLEDIAPGLYFVSINDKIYSKVEVVRQ